MPQLPDPAMSAADLSITLRARRPLCVLDPALAFAHPAAVLLVRRLSGLLDVCMPQAFFRVLDSSDYYGRQPAPLLQWLGLKESEAGGLRHTLTSWQRLRGGGDVLRAPYYWLADSLPDSRLPPGVSGDFVRQAELLNAALHRHCGSHDTLAAQGESLAQESALDTFTLASALDGAFVLTRNLATRSSLHGLGQEWGFASTQHLTASTPLDPYARHERSWLRSLVVQSMASATLWQGLQLAVMHVLAPCASTLDCGSPATDGDDPLDAPLADETLSASPALPDPWEGTHLWWYAL
ncbi:MAG: hypothetical protein ACT4P0_03960 [Panacagrimonas sp.]